MKGDIIYRMKGDIIYRMKGDIIYMSAQQGDYIRILSHDRGHYGEIFKVSEIYEGFPAYQDTAMSPLYVAYEYELLTTFVNPKGFAKKGDKVVLKNLCAYKDKYKRKLKENVIYKTKKAHANGEIILNSGDSIKAWQYNVVSKYKGGK